jgi:hypothetical protein
MVTAYIHTESMHNTASAMQVIYTKLKSIITMNWYDMGGSSTDLLHRNTTWVENHKRGNSEFKTLKISEKLTLSLQLLHILKFMQLDWTINIPLDSFSILSFLNSWQSIADNILQKLLHYYKLSS